MITFGLAYRVSFRVPNSVVGSKEACVKFFNGEKNVKKNNKALLFGADRRRSVTAVFAYRGKKNETVA